MRPVAYWAMVAETVSFRSGEPLTRINVGRLFVLGLAAAVLLPSMVLANADAESPSPGVSPRASATQSAVGILEEVTVTAQKRDTKLENTPIAVSAFTPDFIDRNRIQTLDDVALRTPSVAFVQLNKGEVYISIRGTLVNTPGAGWDDSVTTFIDDVPMTGAGDNSPDLYDLRSIEVLRGPQGTLFGRNVTGGAIVIHTQQPSFDAQGKIEGTYGLDNLAQVRGLWTGPLVGHELAGKLTVDVKRRDGYLNNITLHDKTFGDAVGNGRGQLLWEPSDSLTVLLSGDYTHDQSSGKIVRLSGSLEPSLFPNLSYNPDATNQGKNSETRKNVMGLSARVDWNAAWGTLTSITGLRHVHNDTNWSRLGDPDNQALTTAIVQDKQYTEELRAASASSGRFTWLGGLFYLHADKQENDQYTFNLNPNTVNGGAFPFPILGVGQNVQQHVVDEVGALFGEVSYTILEPLKLTLGGRGQWERKGGSSAIRASFAPGNPLDAFYPLVFPNAAANYSDTWWSFTPKATLAYQVQDGLLLYATTAKGYKSGGWDTSASSDFGKPSAAVAQHLATAFQPEQVWSYELGAKYFSPDRRWQVNAAAFIADYRDMQTNQFNPQTAVFQTSNVGRARAKGIELETTEALTDWLTLGVNYTYQLARYTEYVQSAAQNNTGNAIPETPKHSINLNAETRFMLGSAPGYVTVGGDYTYRSAVHFADSNAEPAFLLEQSKFDGIVNLHTTWNSGDDGWHVSLFATNLANRHTVTYATDVSGFYLTRAEAASAANRIYSVIRTPSRLVGLTVKHEF
ncbi:MAG: TonB-dependent receptor [Gammaproteobacteria bacterium]|nr:TonB-dependent receptor [Gammaproteobacteria bacterium]